MKAVKRDFARLLRQDQTVTEEKAWELLRNGKCQGLKFRRQHVVEGFVVDFYCHEHRLAIELDGSIHDRNMHQDYDKLRQTELEAKGVTFIRVRNEQFEKDENVLLDKIKAVISNSMFHSPSPSGRGGGRIKRQQGVRAV